MVYSQQGKGSTKTVHTGGHTDPYSVRNWAADHSSLLRSLSTAGVVIIYWMWAPLKLNSAEKGADFPESKEKPECS
jgi:hypothetical protein